MTNGTLDPFACKKKYSSNDTKQLIRNCSNLLRNTYGSTKMSTQVQITPQGSGCPALALSLIYVLVFS